MKPSKLALVLVMTIGNLLVAESISSESKAIITDTAYRSGHAWRAKQFL